MQNFESLPELLGTIKIYYRINDNKDEIFDHVEHTGGNLLLMTKRFLEDTKYVKRRKNTGVEFKVGDSFTIEYLKFRVLRYFESHDMYLINIENMEFLPEHD